MKPFHFFVIDNLLVGVAVFLITSCSDVPTPMKNKDGSTANARLVGGKGVLTYGPDGSMSYTYNNEKTILGLAKEVRNFGLGLVAGSVAKDKTASDNSVTASKNASDAATAQKAIDAQAAKDAAAADLAGKKLFIDAGIAKPTP